MNPRDFEEAALALAMRLVRDAGFVIVRKPAEQFDALIHDIWYALFQVTEETELWLRNHDDFTIDHLHDVAEGARDLANSSNLLAALKPADGGPVVLRWDTTPCPASCFSGRVVTTIGGLTATAPCPTCGGSGVVSAVTMWGLEATPQDDPCLPHDSWRKSDAGEVCAWVDMVDDDAPCEFEPRYRLAALNSQSATNSSQIGSNAAALNTEGQ